MTRTMILASAAVLLAACSPPAATTTTTATTAQTASAPSVAAPAGGATSIQPGQYRTTVTIVTMNIPGMPAAQLQQMQAHPMVDEDCVTSSDINDLTKSTLVDADEGETCTDNHMNASSGHIEGGATCQNADGETHTMQVTGSYTSTHVDMDVNMSGQTARGPMSQHLRMATDRIGVCPAQPAQH